jgi:capsule polysaccharide export protein KpsE/RkpR
MTFGERMKEILEQGAAISKDLASKAGEKAQDWGEKGVQASREFINKAGAKAQDMGERGVLMLEIRQLEGRAQKLISRLGSETYTLLVEKGASQAGADEPAISAILSELAGIRESIEKREADLKNR